MKINIEQKYGAGRRITKKFTAQAVDINGKPVGARIEGTIEHPEVLERDNNMRQGAVLSDDPARVRGFLVQNLPAISNDKPLEYDLTLSD